MSPRLNIALLGLAVLTVNAFTQIPLPLGTEGSSATKPEFEIAVIEFEGQHKAIDDEIAPALKEFREKYIADLTDLADKFNQAKRPEEGDHVKAEIKRFNEHGLDSEPAKNGPAQVRALWANYLRNVLTTHQKVAIKRGSITTKFAQTLTALDQTFRASKDAEGLAMVRRARTTLALRNAVENNRIASTDLAGRVNKPWQDVARDGGYLIGLKGRPGQWFQFKVLGGLTPIFATTRGTREGQTRGAKGGTEIIAKDGYAVGGLMIRSGEVVNSLQIVFMRINLDGVTLNPQDYYISDWLGSEGGGKPKEITAHGRMVVGLIGSTESTVQSLGLVYAR
jgi:hypothetical protein